MKDIINKLRYWAILKLSGDIPVVLNMNIVRPKCFDGELILFPNPKRTGLVYGCVLDCGKNRDMAIITPKRDVKL